MRLAGIAGLVAMLVFVLPASAGRDETALERQVGSRSRETSPTTTSTIPAQTRSIAADRLDRPGKL
jgi:hypothetical protein